MNNSYINKHNPSRRDFFTKIVMASLAATLPPMVIGCSEKPKFQGSGKAPYKVWEEMLHYIKTSPDYLPGRMSKLIAEGNAEAMFHFVRDEFYLIPANEKGMGQGNQLKWGVAYALRSGMATMWEKAVLLNRMYTEAGIDSEIVFERTNITPEEAPDFFFRPIMREFLPEISKGMMRHWAKELQIENGEPPLGNVLENEVEEAEALAKKILKTLQLPEDHYYQKFDFRWPNYRTPTVRFTSNGATKYAHLFDSKVPFGALREGDEGRVRVAEDLKTNDDKVTIKVGYRDAIEPLMEKELISGEWLATDLVGRQLDLQFLHGLTLEEMAVTSIGNVRLFTPAFSLQAMDQDQKFMEDRSVLGTPITLSGKKIHVNDEGDLVKVGDAVIRKTSNVNLLKTVDSLHIEAKSICYPKVKLTIAPKDKSGNIVEGLQANDFKITENGKPVSALMENNQRTPRILIMADTSMSMPTEYRGAGMQTFITTLRKKILEKYPAAIIQNWETPSSLYTWLLKASQTENDLVIYATDGDNNDDYDVNNEATYRNGPPAIILNVYKSESKYHTNTFEKMASITNGIHMPISDQQEATEKISAYVDAMEIQPYTFTYNAVGTTEERRVEVSIDTNRRSAEATYYMDLKTKSGTLGPRIIGLYLEIKYANRSVVKRVLAGWEYDIQPKRKPDQQMADAVNDLMLGGMQFYFEGAGPTFSASLCDMLEARLSTRTWGEPLIDNNIGKTKENFQKGFFSIDDKALMLMAPVIAPATIESLTVPSGLRIGMRKVTPGCMTGTSNSSFDYLRTSKFVTLSRKPEEAFAINTEKTAQLAIRENRLFQISTLSELTDKNWIDLNNARKQGWFATHREKDNYYWRERIDRGATLRVFDRDAQSRAFWNIEKSSGELYGILSNQSGGGSDPSHDDIMNALAKIIDLMSRIKVLHPVGAVALGIVAEYGKTLVKLYAIVTEAILIMDTSGMNEAIKAELQAFACTTAKSILFSLAGRVGEIMAGLDELISGITGTGFECN